MTNLLIEKDQNSPMTRGIENKMKIKPLNNPIEFLKKEFITFPDNFLFQYKNIADGYKMVGNAVPVAFAKQLAGVIFKDISEYLKSQKLQKTEERIFLAQKSKKDLVIS